jgi:hypothetical protein
LLAFHIQREIRDLRHGALHSHENIRHYRKLLEEETNEDRRAMIQKLLAQEEAKETAGVPTINRKICK